MLKLLVLVCFAAVVSAQITNPSTATVNNLLTVVGGILNQLLGGVTGTTLLNNLSGPLNGGTVPTIPGLYNGASLSGTLNSVTGLLNTLSGSGAVSGNGLIRNPSTATVSNLLTVVGGIVNGLLGGNTGTNLLNNLSGPLSGGNIAAIPGIYNGGSLSGVLNTVLNLLNNLSGASGSLANPLGSIGALPITGIPGSLPIGNYPIGLPYLPYSILNGNANSLTTANILNILQANALANANLGIPIFHGL